jgi:hypothetical protein
MLCRNGEVETAGAGRGLAVDGVRPCGTTSAGTVLFAIYAVAVVTDAKDETGFDQGARIGLNILHARSPKLGTLGEDLSTRAAAELRRGEHVFPGENGLFEHLGVNLTLQRVIGARVVRTECSAIIIAQQLGKPLFARRTRVC